MQAAMGIQAMEIQAYIIKQLIMDRINRIMGRVAKALATFFKAITIFLIIVVIQIQEATHL